MNTPPVAPPLRYIERTHAWYAALGYSEPYRYASFADVPFVKLRRPLAASRVALLTTAAPYRPELGPQGAGAPYNAAAKFYAVYSLPSDRDHDLRVSHVAIDRAHLSDDSGTWFPLPALRRAHAAGLVGAITARVHGVPTNRSQRHTLAIDAGDLLSRCQQDGADAAVLVANCPICHQTMSLVARHLEANGIATVIMGAAKDIVEGCGVPRLLFNDLPLGHAAGLPHDTASQDLALRLALQLLDAAPAPRCTLQSPLRWPAGDDWRAAYMNPERLSAQELAREQAAYRRGRDTARALRDS